MPMRIINEFLNKVTMYQLMHNVLRGLIAAAVILSFFGVLSFTWWHILIDMALFSVFCFASNYFFSYIFKTKPNPESQYITAEILTLIFGPLNPFTGWLVMFIVSFIAMGSKYLLAYKKRHIFNPAAFGVLATALLLGQGASWWIGSSYMLPFVLVAVFLILQKIKWFHLFLSFVNTYLILLSITLLASGVEITSVYGSVQASLLDSALIFFATIMLVEPLTAPKGFNKRIAYGISIAVLMILHQRFWPLGWPTSGLSIETALIFANLIVFMANPKSERRTLKFVEKKLEAKDTYSFWFEPFKKSQHIPGQYQEWTLPHPNSDSRGIRRFFTIASSPTEDRIRLATKFNPKSSSFKLALQKLKPGDEIYTSNIEGDFILPKENRKLAFIAGGIGITPFLSMMKYLVDKKIKHDIVLFIANKTEEDIVFQELLVQAAEIGVRTIHILSEPNDTWSGYKGFISEEIIQKELPDWKERLFYISGPEGMVAHYKDMLIKMGVPKKEIIKDYFPGYEA
jgi:glycine betaine catabolism B